MSGRVLLSRRWLVLAVALFSAIAPAGCNTVLGLDDLKDRPTLSSEAGAGDGDGGAGEGDVEGDGGADSSVPSSDAATPGGPCDPPTYRDPRTGGKKTKPGC